MSTIETCLQKLLHDDLQQPTVFKNTLKTWSSLKWNPLFLASNLSSNLINFRIGNKLEKGSSSLQWETECQYIEATFSDFENWLSNNFTESSNPLCNIDKSKSWLYADYKYMAKEFSDQLDMIKAVDWEIFGFNNRNGIQSTFWYGSEGSYTPCHQDSYGSNLVAQIYGKKRWYLFPPSQTHFMYPTRIPYEESSLFSEVNIRNPNLLKFPKFKNVTPYVVALQPGDVLFVPNKWWHFVESLETSISVNSWIELPNDDEERLKEAITRAIIFSLMESDETADPSSWLNPTEDPTSTDEHLEYINKSLEILDLKCNSREPSAEPNCCCLICRRKNSPASCECRELNSSQNRKMPRTRNKRACAHCNMNNKITVEKVIPRKLEDYLNHCALSFVEGVNRIEKCDKSDDNFSSNRISIQDLAKCITDPEVVSLITNKVKEKWTAIQ